MDSIKKLWRVIVPAKNIASESPWIKERQRLIKALLCVDAQQVLSEQQIIEFSRHSDGYVREAAVIRLGNSQYSSLSLSALLERLNDWVPEVRATAYTACMGYLQADRMDIWLSCLPGMLRLTRTTRVDHQAFIETVNDLLAHPSNHSAVMQHFVSSQGIAARYLLAQILEWPDIESLTVLQVAKQHSDSLVRRQVIRFCAAARLESHIELLQHLAEDKLPSVRRLACQALFQLTPDKDLQQALLRRLLVDNSASVRATAFFYAKQIRFDVNDLVKQQLMGFPSGKRQDIGLIGLLGLSGNAEYLPWVQKAFADTRPSLQYVALSSWANLSKVTVVPALIEILSNERGKLFRLAMSLVRRDYVVLTGTDLSSAAKKALSNGNIVQFVAISRLMGLWDRLENLLEAFELVQESDAADLLEAALTGWERDQSQSCIPLDQSRRIRLIVLIKKMDFDGKSNLRFAFVQLGLIC